jgi:hypothetical protein
MTDHDYFEYRLEQRLQAYASVTIPPVDAEAVASTVAHRAAPFAWPWTGGGRGSVGLAWHVLLLGLAAAAAVVAGSLLRAEAALERPLLFSTRLGGLYVATAAGSESTAIATSGRYADPRWSPDRRWIAALHGNPPSLEQLPDEELLILRPDGKVASRLDGPIRGFTWIDVEGVGPAVAAIRATDRRVIVIATDGRLVADLDPAAFPGQPSSLAARPTSAGGGILVGAGSSLVEVTDVGHGGRVGAVVASVADGQINAARVSPDGARVAYVHAGCEINCFGTVILRTLSSGEQRTIAEQVGADLVPSWTRSGEAVVVWPNAIPVADGGPIAYNVDARIRDLDVGRWWTRAAPDGRGVWFFRQFPGYNDRRWELWAIDQPAAAPRRLLNDITGADLRP